MQRAYIHPWYGLANAVLALPMPRKFADCDDGSRETLEIIDDVCAVVMFANWGRLHHAMD